MALPLNAGRMNANVRWQAIGIFREGSVNIIGSGVVFDPVVFREECGNVRKMGIVPEEKIVISKKAHHQERGKSRGQPGIIP